LWGSGSLRALQQGLEGGENPQARQVVVPPYERHIAQAERHRPPERLQRANGLTDQGLHTGQIVDPLPPFEEIQCLDVLLGQGLCALVIPGVEGGEDFFGRRGGQGQAGDV